MKSLKRVSKKLNETFGKKLLIWAIVCQMINLLIKMSLKKKTKRKILIRKKKKKDVFFFGFYY